MRTGKIARLSHAIREQLNRRLHDGEQGKAILKWLNALPEVKAVLKEHFEDHPIAASNLTEWKDGGYRDWQVRQDALAMVNNLGDEQALGDKALTDAFNEKLACWVSIHYAATARVVLAEPNADTKWSRLRQLCADVSRLRRSDYHSERIKIEHQRLALQQRKAEQIREEEFKEWLNRPEIQAKYFPKQKRGLSREALALADNYLMEGISPLDPEEAIKLYPFGRYATKPPIGFELPTAENPAPTPDPNQILFPFLEAADGGSLKNTSDPVEVGLAVGSRSSALSAPLRSSNTGADVVGKPASPVEVYEQRRRLGSPPSPNTGREAGGQPTFGHSVPRSTGGHTSSPLFGAADEVSVKNNSIPDRVRASASNHQPGTGTQEHCLTCGNPLPAILPDGTRPSPWCACGSPIPAPPGLSIRERCPYCSAPIPVHGWNTKRLHGRCTACDQNLPPLSETAPLKWLLPDSDWQQRARDLQDKQ